MQYGHSGFAPFPEGVDDLTARVPAMNGHDAAPDRSACAEKLVEDLLLQVDVPRVVVAAVNSDFPNIASPPSNL